jgi:hypothetical protein
MTVRRLNFTGRHKIARKHAIVTLIAADGGPPSFSICVHLEAYDLPPDSLVSVEAYRRMWMQRWELGCTEEVGGTEYGPYVFDGLHDAAGVRFRIKVAAAEADGVRGQLLAAADGLAPTASPDTPPEIVSLLPVGEENLGELIWRIDCDAATSPVLQVSRDLGRGIARTPYFQALVFPAALQQILDAVRLIGGRADDVDEDDWRRDWLRLAQGLAGPCPSTDMSDEEWDGWCSTAVSQFANRHGLQRQYASWYEEGSR